MYSNLTNTIKTWLEGIEGRAEKIFTYRDKILKDTITIDSLKQNRLAPPTILSTLEENLIYNSFQWILEEKARDIKATCQQIANIKKRIDKSNQKRNDCVETINLEIIKKYISMPKESVPLFSETPGSILDRYNILVIRNISYLEMSSKAGKDVKYRLLKIKQQRKDLESALFYLLESVHQGTMRFELYNQFKTYNDSRFNPYLQNKK